MHHFPFHVGDYTSHTRHLSLMEDLAYRRLLDLYYISEAPLAGEPAHLARLICMRDHSVEVEIVLREFFAPGPEGWTNNRCDEEIARYRKQVDAGREGANKRWHTDPNRVAIPPLSPPHPPPNSNQNQNQNHPRNLSVPRRARRCPVDWVIPEEVLTAMRAECPGLDLERETANFRDWEFKDPKTDWAAAWRRWMRKAFDDLKAKPTGETNYARSMREKYEQVSPLIAAKAPRQNPMDVIEGMIREPIRIAR